MLPPLGLPPSPSFCLGCGPGALPVRRPSEGSAAASCDIPGLSSAGAPPVPMGASTTPTQTLWKALKCP